MDLKDIKIGVLGGGTSGEREISLVSAENVCKVLSVSGYRFEFIDITTTSENHLVRDLVDYNLDLAFIALHGEFGEDGRIQQILERIGITYTGSGPGASRLAMDKVLTKKILLEKGISTPEFKVCSDIEFLPKDLSFPIVVKPSSSGSSLGVSVLFDDSLLSKAVDSAFSCNKKIILEEYIPGRELTVGILDDQPLSVVEMLPKTEYYDYEAKYRHGQCDFIASADLPKDIYRKCQEVSLSAHKVLGCRDFSRVDLRLNSKNVPFVLEVNSIPGFTAHSLLPLSASSMGINFSDLIFKIIDMAVSRRAKEAINKV